MLKFYELVVLTVTIISFITYGGVLYIIYKLRKTEFKTPFFTFVLNLGIIDMIRTVVWLGLITFPRWGWFSTVYRGNSFLATFAMFAQLFLSIGQKVNNMLLAANRFTAIVMPYSHRVMWAGGNRRRNVVIGIWLVTIILFQGNVVGLWWSFEYTPVNGTNGFILKAPDAPEWFKVFSYLYMMGQCCLATLWYMVTYTCMIVCGLKSAVKRVNQVTAENSETRAATVNLVVEMRLASACFLLTLVQIVAAVYYWMIAMYPKELMADMGLFYERWYVIVLIDCLTNPWALIAMSSSVRSEFVKQWIICK